MRSTNQVKYIRAEKQKARPRGTRQLSIVIIGFMGSGKSALGARLAKRLGFSFVDLDRAIVQRAGCSIPEIFLRQGEVAFRRMETKVLRQVLRPGQVVATGGGAPLSAKNRRLLARTRVIWIDPSWHELWSRLRRLFRTMPGARPLLGGSSASQLKSQAAVRRLWSSRRAHYQRCADARVRVPAGERASVTLTKLVAAVTRLS